VAGKGAALRNCRGKRDFDRTEELRGRDGSSDEGLRFVEQIHDASTTHFDFRLQVDDVLKSWSVPKGPSADPKAEALERGHATFWLDGSKLRGGYALTRFRGGGGDKGEGEGERGGEGGGGGKDEAWLLVKTDNERARPGDRGTPDPRRARSVRGGRTLRQVTGKR
jgi:bifunctional non-homologous end joining protein LigD